MSRNQPLHHIQHIQRPAALFDGKVFERFDPAEFLADIGGWQNIAFGDDRYPRIRWTTKREALVTLWASDLWRAWEANAPQIKITANPASGLTAIFWTISKGMNKITFFLSPAICVMTTEHKNHAALVGDYIAERWKKQCDYFDEKAVFNQKRFMLMRRMMLISSWLTPIAIFLLILIPAAYRDLYSIIPLLLSTIAVGSYQWEELHNYGANWSKFRLVAQRLHAHKELFLQRSGPYLNLSDEQAARQFIEFCEGLIDGTDVNYFMLMVDPLRRKLETD